MKEFKVQVVKKHISLPDTYLLKPSADLFRDQLENMTSEQRRLVTLQNPVLFGEYYIKPYTRKWNTETADHQYLMLEKMMEHKHIVIHVPIEHAKSTWFSLVVPLWLMCRDRNTQGAIISNTSRQAEGFLASIKWHIEHNFRFKADFGDLIRPKVKGKWTESQIMIERDEEQQSKDPTILAIGVGCALLGARLDWVIADDILDLSNTQSEILRKKVEDWWMEIVDSRIVEDGRKIVLGTLQHIKDLLCHLSDLEDFYYIHLCALDENMNSLWPNLWSVDRILDKKRTMGTIRWKKCLQNDRKSASARMLDVNWLNYWTTILPLNRLRIFIGVDPAICDDRTTAESKQQDKFGLVVVAWDGYKAYLIEEYAEWLTFPQQLKLIAQYNEKYAPFKIGIESVQFQKALAQQAQLLRGLPPVIPVSNPLSNCAC